MTESGTLGVPHSVAPRGTLRAGWRTLVRDADKILLPTIGLSVLAIAAHVAFQSLVGLTVAGSTTCERNYLGRTLLVDCGPSNARAGLAFLVGLFGFLLISHLVVAGIYRVVLGTETPARLAPSRLSALVRVAAVSSLLLTVATIFLLLPALVLGFFTRYTMLFALDQGLGPVKALAASFRLVAADLAGELGFVLRALGVLLLGLLAFGVGLVGAVPVVLIAQKDRYLAAQR